MKKYLSRLWNRLRTSRFAMPVILLLIYLTLASAFILIFELGNNEFGHFRNFIDGIWWAIVTFTTTGYGDKFPTTYGGYIVATISIFLGIGAMSFLSGSLASFFVERNLKIRRGLMNCSNMKDHFVVCGWKDHIVDILKEIVRLNENITSENIVIISNVEPERVEELKNNKVLSALRFIKGDYYSEIALNRANIKNARRALILADELESHAPSEIDSKTVMTVLTIRGISRDVYITVELLDKKFEAYLKQAMCDEIILIRDYSRMLLANSSSTNGITQILYHLLGVEEGSSRIYTSPIPNKYIGKPFKDYKKSVNTVTKVDEMSFNRLIIGILENTGSTHKLKMEALREAQKTSDVSMLISNLHNAKDLEVNKPVLIPADDYAIQRNSMGIILERR
jgi:voltage-gated potassium channel